MSLEIICKELFAKLSDVIKTKLTPAIEELVKTYSPDYFSSIDINKLADVILPSSSDAKPADYVFQYEKNFVKKVNNNQKKIASNNNEVQSLRNKLSVVSRKISHNSKFLSELKTEITTMKVDTEIASSPSTPTVNDPKINDATNLNVINANPLNNDVGQLLTRVEMLEAENSKLNARLDEEICARKCADDNLEQYTRRNTLEFHGIPYRKGENTNRIAIDICRRMGFNISFRDLDRSHRNGWGNRRKNRPPVILVKFLSHDLKEQIHENRELLRKIPEFRNVFINENLTAIRKKLFARARFTFTDFSCWTYDGKIHLRNRFVPGSHVHHITCESDFNSFLNTLQ